MKGVDLEAWCKEQGKGSCPLCPVQKQCSKWKEILKKLSTMEPWQLEEIRKLTKNLIDGYDFKYGKEI